MSCRICKTPKWKGDPCLNPDCSKNTQPKAVLRAHTLPITATTKHGFHAPNQRDHDAGYDAPIHSTRWITGG